MKGQYFPGLKRMNEMNTEIAQRRRRMAGFTLLEIMVVVVIIGLLAAIIAPNVVGNLDRAAITRAKQDIRTIEVGLNQFRFDHFRYPTQDEGLQVLLGGRSGVNNTEFARYLDTLPIDPWGNDYLYDPDGEHDKEYDVYTYGRDGEEGGEGIDADIGNWNLN
jgi:general secretion pathway protein G